jgi:hypothetical protein
MSHATESARVVNVAAGVETTDRTAPVRDGRHQALAVLVGGGMTQVARHESSADGVSWAASMDVTLRKVV